jgi:hypothetical protein
MDSTKQFHIGTCVVTVEPVEQVDKDEFGQWFAKKKKIIYDSNLVGIEKGRTIFHELIHAHCFIMGHTKIGNDENIINAMETLYLSLFDPRNNEILTLLQDLYETEDKPISKPKRKVKRK